MVETTYAVDLFDRTNPRAVINLLPPVTQAKIFQAHTDRADLFRLPEKELKKAAKPTPTLNRIRLSFWTEYDASQVQNREMNMRNVYAGVCTQQFFDHVVLNEPVCVAWMLMPPANYLIALSEMLVTSQERLREILEQSAVDEATGKVDTKLGELQLKIHQAVEVRVKGATIQRSEIKSLSVSADLSDTQAIEAVKKIGQIDSMQEIEEKLARIRKENDAKARKAARSSLVVEGEQIEPRREDSTGEG